MINYLNIKNIGIIDDITVEFFEGLNIITGETGAGKTLLIDSLGYICGGKFDKDKISKGADFASVTISLNIDEEEYVIHRKQTLAGKSLFKINGEMVSKKEVQEFMLEKLDIHGQKENQNILEVSSQRKMVDRYIQKYIEGIRDEYISTYTEYVDTFKKYDKLKNDGGSDLREIDLLKYQIDEIKAAGPSEEEEKSLEKEYNTLLNYEKISKHLNILREEVADAVGNLSSSKSEIDKLIEIDIELEEEKNIIENAYYELEEVSITLSKMHDIEYDERKLRKIEDRIEEYVNLKRKYGGSVDQVLKFQKEAEERLEEISFKDEKLAELDKEKVRLEKILEELADKMFKLRQKASKEIAEKINIELKDLEMSGAKFAISLKKTEVFTKEGKDYIEFMISTNKGEEEKKLNKIASGGEMSRIMLSIKRTLGDADNTNILVFDEIDTGISGKVGQKVGFKMREIAEKHQVLCVTHLPSIAALGDHNYYISKEEKEGRVNTSVVKLNKEETIKEVARIIGGEITENSLNNAKELIAEKEKIKNISKTY